MAKGDRPTLKVWAKEKNGPGEFELLVGWNGRKPGSYSLVLGKVGGRDGVPITGVVTRDGQVINIAGNDGYWLNGTVMAPRSQPRDELDQRPEGERDDPPPPDPSDIPF